MSPVDKGWKCNNDNNYMCPEGMTCDKRPDVGLCVHMLPDLGVNPSDLGFKVDLNGSVGPRSCDQRVQAGAFSGLVALGSLNTAGDETNLSITGDGKRLFYLGGGQVLTATVNGKTAAAPVAVAIANAPATLRGGSVNADGSFWFAGDDGAGGATSLFKATGTLPNLTAVAQLFPSTANRTSMCPFNDPVFQDGVATKELYLSFALGGCGTAPYIARGANNKQLGAFYAAFSQPGFRYPSLLPGGLTMMFGSTPPSQQRLFYAVRSSTDDTSGDTGWTGPIVLPLGALADSAAHDLQAVVSPDCTTLYLVSSRAGGSGGADLWAADIAAQ